MRASCELAGWIADRCLYWPFSLGIESSLLRDLFTAAIASFLPWGLPLLLLVDALLQKWRAQRDRARAFDACSAGWQEGLQRIHTRSGSRPKPG